MRQRGQATLFGTDGVTLYCLDTSALVELRKGMPLDIAPTIWNKLDELMQAGRLMAPAEVLKELKRQDDQLARWAQARNKFFLSPDEEQQVSLIEVMNAFPDCVKEYQSGGPFADPYVVALARIRGASVLTFEKKDEKNVKPKIPNMCEHFGIVCMNTHEMFRKESLKF